MAGIMRMAVRRYPHTTGWHSQKYATFNIEGSTGSHHANPRHAVGTRPAFGVLHPRRFSAQAGVLSPLFAAAAAGTADQMKLLLETEKNLASEEGKANLARALLLAAKAGHAEVLKMLLAAGAEIDAPDQDGKAALLIAAEAGHAEAVEALLEAGAEVDRIDKRRTTALARAAREGHASVVAALLRKRAKVNLQDKAGRTALMVARGAEVRELLKNRGGKEFNTACSG